MTSRGHPRRDLQLHTLGYNSTAPSAASQNLVNGRLLHLLPASFLPVAGIHPSHRLIILVFVGHRSLLSKHEHRIASTESTPYRLNVYVFNASHLSIDRHNIRVVVQRLDCSYITWTVAATIHPSGRHILRSFTRCTFVIPPAKRKVTKVESHDNTVSVRRVWERKSLSLDHDRCPASAKSWSSFTTDTKFSTCESQDSKEKWIS